MNDCDSGADLGADSGEDPLETNSVRFVRENGELDPFDGKP